jgi:protocatechuate 3,4-dioxygenase beta subunit
MAAIAAAALPHNRAQAQAAPGSKRVTPEQSLGPFYPRSPAEMPRETDADLLATDNERILAKGTPLYLTGRVIHRSGTVVANALVEIWQCDANAVYHHPAGGAEASRDSNFQGYGSARTDSEGVFHFRTIRPVRYPGRTPHIHMRVASSVGTLATQWYLPNEPGNARDVLYRSLNTEERAALTLTLREGAPAAHPLARLTRLSAQVEVVVG